MSVNTRTREPVDLYDLAEDPNELFNRVDDAALGGVVQDLRDGHLAGLLATVDESKLPEPIEPPPKPARR